MLCGRSVNRCIITLVLVILYTRRTTCQFNSETACYNADKSSCNTYKLVCPDGQIVYPLSQKYGTKDGKCNMKNNCFRLRDGCCVYSTTDCFEYWTRLHTYNMYKECSGRQECVRALQAPFNVLSSSCNGSLSTYVHIEYECTPESNVVHFCDTKTLSGTEVNMVFDRATDVYDNLTDCSCFVTAPSATINVNLIDVRLMKAETSGSGRSSCSSATLLNMPGKELMVKCNETLAEETNFIYNNAKKYSYNFLELKLLDLYKTGTTDAPTKVWLSVTGGSGDFVNVTCFKHETTPVVTSPSYSVDTTNHLPSNTTLTTDGDDSKTGAVVAGVVVPIIVLAIVGAIVGCLIWRRKKRNRTTKHVVPNSYEGDVGTVYDEIRCVPEAAHPNPVYDFVNEPGESAGLQGTQINGKLKHQKDNQASNRHTYVNVVDKREANVSKKSKGRFGLFRSKADKFISYFRKQTESDVPTASIRGREDSGVSYDHIRPLSALQVHISPSSDEPGHIYAHAKEQSDGIQTKPTDIPKKNKTPETINNTEIPHDIDAVHIGDSYIEFQFGADKNDPNLVKINDSEQKALNSRPVPPSRPPPSPENINAKASPPNPNVLKSKSTTNNLPVTKDALLPRPKSPNQLSTPPINIQQQETYDYATDHSQPTRRKSPRGSDASHSDISEHSYKVLEEQSVYDYADMSGEEGDEVESVSFSEPSIYEDVEASLRAASVKKHKSSSDLSPDVYGYEEPKTGHIRPQSSPMAQQIAKHLQVKSTPDISQLNKKLKEKSKLRPVKNAADKTNETVSNSAIPKHGAKPKGEPIHTYGNISKQVISDHKDVVKGDNTKTKDYEKPVVAKGVMKMAMMFEQKTSSDSESDHQQSPREVKLGAVVREKQGRTKDVSNHKTLDRMSSDA